MTGSAAVTDLFADWYTVVWPDSQSSHTVEVVVGAGGKQFILSDVPAPPPQPIPTPHTHIRAHSLVWAASKRNLVVLRSFFYLVSNEESNAAVLQVVQRGFCNLLARIDRLSAKQATVGKNVKSSTSEYHILYISTRY